jgi:hypothetical protein
MWSKRPPVILMFAMKSMKSEPASEVRAPRYNTVTMIASPGISQGTGSIHMMLPVRTAKLAVI